ncbi:MAG: sugar transferase [Flavobacteriales bacterium]|jgi:exopolysaccharide biosynthesis polyprenyl glycosylphosphotransferase|nr:sugar transferase [Flavobacteriales bacterium]
MNASRQAIIYFTLDLLTAASVWFLFYIYRIINVEKTEVIFKEGFYQGLVLIPLFWVFLYAIQGTYRNVLRKYRLKTIKNTLFATLMGGIVVFFSLLLNDVVYSYKQYYTLFFVLIGLHFLFTLTPRLILTTYLVKRIHSGKFGFNTIILGGSDKAIEIYEDIQKLKKNSGHRFIGFVNINGSDFKLSEKLKHLGEIDKVEEIIVKQEIQEVIIALESSEHERLKGLITKLSGYDIKISIIPDSYDILSGQVKMDNIFGALLITVNANLMPDWQYSTKRLIDIVASFVSLLILLPVYLTLAILVKLSSKGPIFFTQERIGLMGKPFKIIKFRTMYVDAEKNGPQLSSSHDSRITPIGRFLRKTRLDEFPQFWNVLRGDMSLVGPRPERQFYIDQISEKDPQYLYLHKVRPGITSWGQVKFGYAENVEQMVERMKYDLLYIRNMSLALDFKIMFYTIAIIFKGEGK